MKSMTFLFHKQHRIPNTTHRFLVKTALMITLFGAFLLFNPGIAISNPNALGGGSSGPIQLNASIAFDSFSNLGLYFEPDFAIGPVFSIAPRIGFINTKWLDLGASFLFGIISPNRPTGFGVGPFIDLGLSDRLIAWPGGEFSYKYTFPFHLVLGGSFKLGIVFQDDEIDLGWGVHFKVGFAVGKG